MKTVYSLILGIEIIIIVFFLFKIVKKNVFVAAFYALLSYFCLVFSVCYLFYPDELMQITYVQKGVFDKEAKYWLKYNAFVFLSLIALFIIIRFSERIKKYFIIVVEDDYSIRKRNSSKIALFILVFITLLNLCTFILNYKSYSYANSLESSNLGISYRLSGILILFSMYYMETIIALMLNKDVKGNTFRKLFYVCAFFNASVIILYSLKTGDKSTLFSALLGVFCFMMSKANKKSFVKIMKLLPLALVTYVVILIALRSSRGYSLENLLRELMFPSSMAANMFDTFAVIRYNYINSAEVVISTISKSFILTKRPYLFETLGPLYATFELSGKRSFAHFLFADGYVFSGMSGILYNGMVIGFFINLYRKITETNDEKFNRAMFFLLGSMSVNLIRGSGMGNFIKYIYLYVLPSILIYSLLARKRIKIHICS